MSMAGDKSVTSKVTAPYGAHSFLALGGYHAAGRKRANSICQ